MVLPRVDIMQETTEGQNQDNEYGQGENDYGALANPGRSSVNERDAPSRVSSQLRNSKEHQSLMDKNEGQLKQRNLTSANQAIKPAKLDRDSKSQQSFGGFNRDAIRSQDQQRVEKYVKNQEKLKNDNPIMKFVNYQSYK